MRNKSDPTKHQYQPIDRRLYAMLHCGTPWLIFLFFAGLCLILIFLTGTPSLSEEDNLIIDHSTGMNSPSSAEGAVPYSDPIVP